MRRMFLFIMALAMFLPIASGLNASEVTVGAGGESARYPFDFEYHNSLYQCLYYPDELGITNGTITQLKFYNDFTSIGVFNKPIKVWLGSTQLNDLGGGFIPSTSLHLVYDGVMNFPTGENTITIYLQIPYMYLGGNLVLMCHRPYDSNMYSSADFFKCQSGAANRARYTRNYSHNPDNPPIGQATAQFPKTTFVYTDQPILNDLAALGLTGPDIITQAQESSYTITLRNNGVNTQANYQIKLMNVIGAELTSVAGPAINAFETLQFDIPWIPTDTGYASIYGKVVLSGDEYGINNETPALDVTIMPAGLNEVSIGEGNESVLVPLNYYYRNSLYQSLYYADEIGLPSTIHGLVLYSQFLCDLEDMPVKIWMCNTVEDDLTGGWIPAGEMTLVFDGTVNFPMGESEILIPLQGPFCYRSGNLVIMYSRPTCSFYIGSNMCRFKGQTVGSTRARHAFSDVIVFDPYNPQVPGVLSGQFPKTTLMFNPLPVGSISGCVRGENNQPLSGASVTLSDGLHSTTTNDAGQYTLPNVVADNYSIFFNAHGYLEHTQAVTLGAGNDLTLNADLLRLPQVTVSGVVLGCFYLGGVSNACIQLSGYESYQTFTNREGEFTISGVYANCTYAYTVTAAGYTPVSGQITVGNSNYQMGLIDLEETFAAVENVLAEVNHTGDAVNINWQAPAAKSDNHLTGYLVYRLLYQQMENQDAWIALTPHAITALGYTDTAWQTLPPGNYCWAVKAAYQGGIFSLPSFSNPIWKGSGGWIEGTVKKPDGSPIAGANVGSQYISITTDASGFYSLFYPIGSHSITASAPGFVSQTIDNVIVIVYDTITLDFVLEPQSAGDDPQIPVLTTALNGNYPNPFNPETTISYSVKEAGRVKLEVYNLKGQLVRTLVDGDHASGNYKRVLDSRDDRGRSISSGVYLIRMSAPGYQKVSRMMLMQ